MAPPDVAVVSTEDTTVAGLQTFLRALYPTDTGLVELRALPSKAQVFVSVGDEAGVAEFLSDHDDENVFVGVATRATPMNGSAANCAELFHVFCDIDFKHVAEADARAALAAFPLSPSLVVGSGNGLHCYWACKEPFTLPAEAGAATVLLRRLARHFRGDHASAEVARILRVPGSRNFKYDPPRFVALERHAAVTYNASEFDEWLPPEPVRPNGSNSEAPFTVPSTIRDGERNTWLYRSARSMHAKGWSAAAILAALHAENGEKCAPPLSSDEVTQIAAHAATQPDAHGFDPRPGPRASVGAETPDEEEPTSFAEPCPAFLVRLSTQDRPPDLVPGLIPSVGSGTIHGQPRTLKSFALLELGLACATATPAFSLAHLTPTTAVTVWYVTEEDPEIEVRDRLRALLAGRQIAAPDGLLLSIQRALALDDPAWQARVIDYARTHGVAFAIIDPIRASTSAVDAGPRELQPFATFARRFRRETGAVLWLGHHDVKPPRDGTDTRSRPQRASGGGLFSIIDSPIHAERVDETRVLLTPSGYKFGAAPDSLIIRLDADASTRPTWMRVVGEVTTGTDAVRLALHEQILALLTDHAGLSGTKVAQQLRRNKVDVLGALETLRHAGRVDYYTRGQAHLWFVPKQETRPCPVIQFQTGFKP